jgi:hypothetical protein
LLVIKIVLEHELAQLIQPIAHIHLALDRFDIIQMPQRPAAPSFPVAVAPTTAPALVQVDSDSDSSQPGPAVLISPVKAGAAKQGIANKSDKDVWSLLDNDIIGEWLFPLKK